MSAPGPDDGRPWAAEAPVLLLCAHGSRSPAAQRTTARLAEQAAQLLPGTEVIETWVDVQTPDVAQRCAQLAHRPVVIVPLLLAAGYHVRHDLARAVAGREHHVAVGALGPDPRLSSLLLRRLDEAEVPGEPIIPSSTESSGAGPSSTGPSSAGAADASASSAPQDRDGPVVLIAAGSSDDRAVADVRAQAEDLARRTGREVEAGFVSAAQPSAAEAVRSLQERTGRAVTAASFLLSPGQFHDRAAEAGADVLTAPLLSEDGAAEEILTIVLERWREGLEHLGLDDGCARTAHSGLR